MNEVKKYIPIYGCFDGCSNITFRYPTEEAEKEAEALVREDFKSLMDYIAAKHDLTQAYCMENDDPPYQFVLRPIEGDLYDVPEWCGLPDAPEILRK